MTQETHLQTAEAFTRAFGYEDDDRVRAVYLIGSSASGKEDVFSDVDMMVAVNAMIPGDERLSRLLTVGCRSVTIAIAGAENPALPVQSQAIDRFLFHDTWFDVGYHLPHQLEFCFEYVPLVDKDGLTTDLCKTGQSYSERDLQARAQADLRLLHARIYRYEKYARRREWIGMDLAPIKKLLVDVVMVLNDRPDYNRHTSRVSQMLGNQSIKPKGFERKLLDILHMDNRETWKQKLEMLHQLEVDLTAMCEARWGRITMHDDEG